MEPAAESVVIERGWPLAVFEPDPDAMCATAGQTAPVDAEGLDWVTWEDADGEQSWAMVELAQITFRAPGAASP